jgi:hypothetical protein
MLIYPDDRVLVAVINNLEDWQRVQDEQWYRIPTKHAPEPVPNIDILAFFSPNSVHNQETLSSVHNREKSRLTLTARFVLDFAQVQPMQMEVTLLMVSGDYHADVP